MAESGEDRELVVLHAVAKEARAAFRVAHGHQHLPELGASRSSGTGDSRPASATADSTKSTMRVEDDCSGKPRISLKSVRPLLPPKPISLRKNASISAKVMACVMIDRYTPVTRDRKANQPNTKASDPGTSSTMTAAKGNQSKPCQNQGSSFQFRNTMKSGRTGSA